MTVTRTPHQVRGDEPDEGDQARLRHRRAGCTAPSATPASGAGAAARARGCWRSTPRAPAHRARRRNAPPAAARRRARRRSTVTLFQPSSPVVPSRNACLPRSASGESSIRRSDTAASSTPTTTPPSSSTSGRDAPAGEHECHRDARQSAHERRTGQPELLEPDEPGEGAAGTRRAAGEEHQHDAQPGAGGAAEEVGIGQRVPEQALGDGTRHAEQRARAPGAERARRADRADQLRLPPPRRTTSPRCRPPAPPRAAPERPARAARPDASRSPTERCRAHRGGSPRDERPSRGGSAAKQSARISAASPRRGPGRTSTSCRLSSKPQT